VSWALGSEKAFLCTVIQLPVVYTETNVPIFLLDKNDERWPGSVWLFNNTQRHCMSSSVLPLLPLSLSKSSSGLATSVKPLHHWYSGTLCRSAHSHCSFSLYYVVFISFLGWGETESTWYVSH
jgi:hypothetical protein